MDELNDRPDIIDVVKTVAQERGIKNGQITDVKMNEKGEGFLGQIFMITIKEPTSEERLEVVIKAAFTNEAARNIISIEKCYKNEGYFYSTIYPAFKKFERSKGIVERIELVPKCYKVILDNKKELLCLENLRNKSFELFDKKLSFDHDHVSLIFKTYGRLHGYSFLLQDQQPEEYDRFIGNVDNLYVQLLTDEKSGFAANMKEFYKIACTSLVRGEDDALIEKFGKYKDDHIVNSIKKIVSEKWDYSVIIHGDAWSNNMMFKYQISENGKKLSDMRLLDLQVIRVASPVCDLAHCLYTGASKRIFDNLGVYLKIYYDSLSSLLKDLGSDPEKLFPFEALKTHWKKYSKFGMFIALMVIKMKLTDKEEIKDFTDELDGEELGKAAMASKFDKETYQRRIRELLYHMSEIDAL